jgi:hypothetical protein
MQNKNRVCQLRHINHPVLIAFIPHPDFLHTGPDRRHWLPILRFLAALNPIELKSCISPCRIGETAQLIK